ncbi:hypothetical protein HYC85_011365 [Camellia sinensis]|uniref:Uncharacterized protein n=1 Tax=Camellia sinensis TaxID=4442 RepID=A0A7J7H8U5_CAMSI|nr:hypothetical protein HYC85_011365 [Camellia sinensis]
MAVVRPHFLCVASEANLEESSEQRNQVCRDYASEEESFFCFRVRDILQPLKRCMEGRDAISSRKVSFAMHSNKGVQALCTKLHSGNLYRPVEVVLAEGLTVKHQYGRTSETEPNIRDCSTDNGRIGPNHKLDGLDLRGNSFNNYIIPSLGVFSLLKILCLRENNLNGSIDIDIREFCNMNLKELDLSANSIEDIKVCMNGGDLKRKLIFAGFELLSALGKLELLRLDSNSFNNNILQSLGVLSSLKTLSLSSNSFNESIDIGDLDQRPMEEGDGNHDNSTGGIGLGSEDRRARVVVEGGELSTAVTTTVTQKGGAAVATV